MIVCLAKADKVHASVNPKLFKKDCKLNLYDAGVLERSSISYTNEGSALALKMFIQ